MIFWHKHILFINLPISIKIGPKYDICIIILGLLINNIRLNLF